MRRLPTVMGAILLTPGWLGIAAAQNYPARPVTMIVPFPAGGATDTLARFLGERMRAILGQPVIIENVAGAAGSLGVGRAVRSPADGYTLSIGTSTTHMLTGGLYALQFDLLKDLEPVIQIGSEPLLIVGKKSLPADDLKGLIAGATRIGKGLGLWPDVLIDQHFLKRQRDNRLISAVMDRPALVGVGIDEGGFTVEHHLAQHGRDGFALGEPVAPQPGQLARRLGKRCVDADLTVQLVRQPEIFDQIHQPKHRRFVVAVEETGAPRIEIRREPSQDLPDPLPVDPCPHSGVVELAGRGACNREHAVGNQLEPGTMAKRTDIADFPHHL